MKSCIACDRSGVRACDSMPMGTNGRHVDPATGIAPICEWGHECGRGFVRDSRFGSGQVIKGTNRAAQRKRGGIGPRIDAVGPTAGAVRLLEPNEG